MNGKELVEKVIAEYGTTDAFELAQKAGCKVVYARWQPITLGEYHRKTQTIYLNDNTEGALKRVLAHELGHFFCDKYAGMLPKKVAENIAETFAEALFES